MRQSLEINEALVPAGAELAKYPVVTSKIFNFHICVGLLLIGMFVLPPS